MDPEHIVLSAAMLLFLILKYLVRWIGTLLSMHTLSGPEKQLA